MVTVYGDGKSLSNHSQYNKGLVELKNQSLEIYHGLNVCYALSKIITPCKLEEYKRNLKESSKILKDVILSKRYKDEVLPFDHVIIYFVISSICGLSRDELLNEVVNNSNVMNIIKGSYPNLKVLLNSIAQCDYKTYRLAWIKMNVFYIFSSFFSLLYLFFLSFLFILLLLLILYNRNLLRMIISYDLLMSPSLVYSKKHL